MKVQITLQAMIGIGANRPFDVSSVGELRDVLAFVARNVEPVRARLPVAGCRLPVAERTGERRRTIRVAQVIVITEGGQVDRSWCLKCGGLGFDV